MSDDVLISHRTRPGTGITQRSFYGILQRWALALPAVIAFGLYALVLVKDRYVGVFVLLFCADILSNIRLPETDTNGRWLRTLGLIACLGLLANIALFNLDGFKRLNPPWEQPLWNR